MYATPEACISVGAPGKSGLLHRKTRGCASVHCLFSALGVAACQEPSLQLPQSHRNVSPSPGHQSQKIKGHPLSGSHTQKKKKQGSRRKNQHTRRVQSSIPRDTLLWDMTEEKHKDSTCSLWSLERITVSLWIYVQLEACPSGRSHDD